MIYGSNWISTPSSVNNLAPRGSLYTGDALGTVLHLYMQAAMTIIITIMDITYAAHSSCFIAIDVCCCECSRGASGDISMFKFGAFFIVSCE